MGARIARKPVKKIKGRVPKKIISIVDRRPMYITNLPEVLERWKRKTEKRKKQ